MSTLTFGDILIRLLLAFAAGAIVGYERSSRGRPAGLRTTILACVASATAMIISETLFAKSGVSVGGGNWRPDPARLGAGILTGIGFLGAGTILRHENTIRGVTTAACLWFVTVLGLAFGSGEIALGLAGFGIGLVTLFVVPRFEKHIEYDRYVTFTVVTMLPGMEEDELRKRLEARGAHIKTVKISYDFEKRHKTMAVEIRLKRKVLRDACKSLLTDIANTPGITRAAWE